MSQNDYYRDGNINEFSQTHSWRTAKNSLGFLLSHIKQTDKILDVGCGPGTISVDISQYVPEGIVYGIDTEKELIDDARREAASQKVTNVDFRIGSATLLPFEDNVFDIVYAHQVLLHLSDPVQALSEMMRVVKKDGIVCCRDADLDSVIVYPLQYANPIGNTFVGKSRRSTSSIYGGRELVHKALKAGFQQDKITFSTSSWCIASSTDRKWFHELYKKRISSSEDKVGDKFTKKEIADAWTEWEASEDGVLILVHGEIICKKTT